VRMGLQLQSFRRVTNLGTDQEYEEKFYNADMDCMYPTPRA